MIRKVTALSLVTLGLLAPAVAAVPASAGAGGTDVGCTDSSSCAIFLEKQTTFGGNTSSGSGLNASVPITPPPCLWIPAGNATSGSQQVINDGGGYAPPPATLNTAAVKQAKQLQKNPKPGTWYELPVRQGDTAAETQQCMALPYYYWLPPGGQLPQIPIPPETLRDLAFAKLSAPKFQSMQLNPATRSYTNLPTFVKARLTPGTYQQAPNGQVYLAVSASLGNQSATVWVPSDSFTITAPNATAWGNNNPQCSQVDSQGMIGSKWTPGQMQHAGPNQAIDCGATFTRPGTYQVQATLTWKPAVWEANTGPNGYQTPPPAGAQPVPNGQLGPTWTARNVPVAEIQSINNGG